MKTAVVPIPMLLNIKGKEVIVVTKFSLVHHSILARDTVQRNSPDGKCSLMMGLPDIAIFSGP